MALSDAELGKLLLDLNYLSEEDVKKAETQAKAHSMTLKDALTELDLLSQNIYESAIAEYYHLSYYDLSTNPPVAALVDLLPEDIGRNYNAIIVKQDKDTITVATSDPTNKFLEEAVRLNFGQSVAMFPEKESADKKSTSRKSAAHFSFGKTKTEERKKYTGKIEFAYAARKALEAFFVQYRKPLATRFQQIIDENKKVAPEILEEIFNDAIGLRASDIHFEPQEKIVVVRFRVDGVLHEAGRIPKEYYEGVVNRMKIASNMHIDEHFMAQDGAIRYDTGNGNTMDIRVSIVPIVDGEKIVLRLLSEYVRSLTLADLGFSEVHRAVLERASHKPFGMILTTGPTGSGKSTTLYALLKLRNHPDVNISTIEDPVEYKVPGINHIQVNTETNLTFANGLRALMRQDPNIILVGEIRDGETASIAVNAALTGHLLFSTLHANDAVTSVPRLLEMGVEPFLLASTLEVVIAQRLVRRICPSCRYSYSVSAAEIPKLFPHSAKFFESKKGILLYKGKGCEACGGIGYSGRIGIYELLIITPEIEELIVKRCSSAEIEKLARSKGMRSLFEDGFDKMLAGATTLEELLRVASPPDAPAPHVKDKKD
jgi:type II secretory ATPase GspE/PulE/Tfp pilus assembly ATPase PilB-like protein